MNKISFVATLLALTLSPATHASVAYGSLNNFDTVNDTGVQCHGFEIEIDDIHSKDITYTYDWNHYGVPTITEDNTDPLHPKVFVRYASKKNPDNSWAAFTAIPSAPIAPTQGHQFTNPSVNFGGEHFGVGYYGTPSGVKYNWLIDDGAGTLIHGPAVNIATPTFVYAPPAGGALAQVQAAIVPPPPPAPPVLEFGVATWVKEIRTSTHSNKVVELKDLISPDPSYPGVKDWTNNEPAEVEVEWQILQKDSGAVGGGPNGELKGAPEELPNGDEVITRRYEFYEYTGPVDTETGEAMGAKVGPDGIHGVGSAVVNGVTVDLTTVAVVGGYIGAQMSGFKAATPLGLIDHLQDGEINTAYIDRTVVVGGTPPYIATITSGALPTGMSFDQVTGVVSGTPTARGVFTLTVGATDLDNNSVTKTYTLTVTDAGVIVPAHSSVDTIADPGDRGSTTGDGDFLNGTSVTVVATPNLGSVFSAWTENGAQVSTDASYQFTLDAHRVLVGHFLPVHVPSDVNGDGHVDAVDVQLVINGALAINSGPVNTDVDGDKSVNAIDVQAAINGAL